VTHPVAGMKFFLRRFTISGLALATAQILETVRAADPDEALAFIVNDLKVDTYLFLRAGQSTIARPMERG
jgi:hypothetical protein